MPRTSKATPRVLAASLSRFAVRAVQPRQLTPTTTQTPQPCQGRIADRDSSRPHHLIGVTIQPYLGGTVHLQMQIECHRHDAKNEIPRRSRASPSKPKLRWKHHGYKYQQPRNLRQERSTNSQNGEKGPTQFATTLGRVQDAHAQVEERGSQEPQLAAHDPANLISRELAVTPVVSPVRESKSRPSQVQKDPAPPLEQEPGRSSVTRPTTKESDGDLSFPPSSTDTSKMDDIDAHQKDSSIKNTTMLPTTVVPIGRFAPISRSPPKSTSKEAVIHAKEEPIRPLQLRPRFRPYQSNARVSVLSKILTPLSRTEMRPGEIYIFRRASLEGHVKIGWTSRGVSERLRGWAKCGEKPVLVHQTAVVSFARRLEGLIQQELADVRREEVYCSGCNSAHIEWFEMPADRAVQVVDKWTKIVCRYGLYDADGLMSAFWARLIGVLQRENATINAQSLLRRYEELTADNALCDAAETNEGEGAKEALPILEVADDVENASLTNSQSSVQLDPALRSATASYSSKESAPLVSCLEKTPVASPLFGTTQAMAKTTITLLPLARPPNGGSHKLAAPPDSQVQMRQTSVLLLPPPKTIHEQFHASSKALWTDPSIERVQETICEEQKSLCVVDQEGAVQPRHVERTNGNKMAYRTRIQTWGILLTLVAIDALSCITEITAQL